MANDPLQDIHSVRNRNSVWCAIVDADNRIVSEESFELGQASAVAN